MNTGSIPVLASIDIKIKEKKWYRFIGAIRSTIEYVLQDRKVKVQVILSNDDEIHYLNNKYRNKDKPTNVLSFPINYEENNYIVLGDIIISYNYSSKEAKNLKIKYKDYFCFLAIHGILHLLGYDHEEDFDAFIMEGVEKMIINYLNLKDPYEAV